MEYIKPGNSDSTISRICLGYMGLGDPQKGQYSWTLDEKRFRETIKRVFELGVNFFDTAITYQGRINERLLGHVLKDFTEHKDVAIITKSLPRTPEKIVKRVNGQEHIRRMTDKSLKNLDVDYVDPYTYHMWDYQTSLYDITDGLNRVVKTGKARYVGISNCFAWQLAKVNVLTQQEGFVAFISVRGHYSPIFWEEEREVVPYCGEGTIAPAPYNAPAGGRLSRRPEETPRHPARDGYVRFKYDKAAEQDQVIVGRAAELTDHRNVSMVEVASTRSLTKVTSPVVGATKLQHVEEAVASEKPNLTGEELAYLEDAYVPHRLTGIVAQNRPETHSEAYTWSLEEQKI